MVVYKVQKVAGYKFLLFFSPKVVLYKVQHLTFYKGRLSSTKMLCQNDVFVLI